MAEVKSFGITKSLFILDRGFYSESNIKEMTSEHIDFILPLPFSVNTRNKWKLTEISKKQRTILEKMKAAIPVEASLVKKRGGV